jgi:hypothetical protein
MGSRPANGQIMVSRQSGSNLDRRDEISDSKSASIRQPHWHRHLDVKRPSRAFEELRQVAGTRTERRLYVQVAANNISLRSDESAVNWTISPTFAVLFASLSDCSKK